MHENTVPQGTDVFTALYAQRGIPAAFRLGGQKPAWEIKKKHEIKSQVHIFANARLPEPQDRSAAKKRGGQYAANVLGPMQWSRIEQPRTPEKTSEASTAMVASEKCMDDTEQTAGKPLEPSPEREDAQSSDEPEAAGQEDILPEPYAPPEPSLPCIPTDEPVCHNAETEEDAPDNCEPEAGPLPVEEEAPCAEGFLAYKQLWYQEVADISVNGKLLSGTPISLKHSTLRVVNETYSYIIPLHRVDYIRTCDGYKTACERMLRGFFEE